MTERTWIILVSIAPLVLGACIPLLLLATNSLRRRALRAEDDGDHLRRQLKVSQKLETFGSLTAGLTHDLNNIFMALQGSLELMAMPNMPEDKRKAQLANVAKAAKQGSDILHRILTITRKSTGKVEVDLRDVIADMESVLVLLVRKKIVIVLDTSTKPVPVVVDKSGLFQVMMNLVVNARDAMGDEGVLTIDIRPKGARALLSVTDTGSGIPEELLERIFEPLFTTKPEGKGTGLGLSIVQEEVRQMGGTLSVDSEVGQGTTFTISLPLVRGNQQ